MTTSSGASRPTSTRPKPPREPSDLIVAGIGVIVLGWFVAGFMVMAFDGGVLPLMLGWVASLVGGLLLFIGAVAAGVRLGMQWAERDRLS